MFKKYYLSVALFGLFHSLNAMGQSIGNECELAPGSTEEKPIYKVDMPDSKLKSNTIAIVTGSKSGTYTAFGSDIAKLIQSNNSDFNICVKHSKGSLDNVKRMASSENAGLGIAQSDVIEFIRNHQIDLGGRAAKELRLIAPLYNEEVHILTRKNFKSMADLKGKKVNVGPEGGGSWVTAVTLFQALYPSGQGIPNYQFQDHEFALKALMAGDLDAMVFVAGKPVKMFSSLSSSSAKKLKDLHFVNIDKNIKAFSGLPYVTAVIAKDDYPWTSKETQTIAVKSQLISYDFSRPKSRYFRSRCSQFEDIGNLLRGNIEKLQSPNSEWHSKWQQVKLDAKVEGWERDLCSWNSLSIVTGSPTGTYFKIGKDIAELTKKEVFMEVKNSEGSVDNINRLRIDSGENAAISIVQSDVISEFKHSTLKENRAMAKNLRLIMPLYNEEIHLLASQSIRSFQDLDGKIIATGGKKSGSYMTAKNLTKHLSKPPKLVHLTEDEIKQGLDEKAEAFQKLKNGEVDAILFVGGKPLRFFKETLGKRFSEFPESFDNLHILPVFASDLPKGTPYVVSEISKDDYPWVASVEPIPSLAVKSLLVSRDYSSKKDKYHSRRCEQINKIYTAIEGNIQSLKTDPAKHKKWQEVNLGETINDWPLDACAHRTKKPVKKNKTAQCDKYITAAYKAKNIHWSKDYSECVNQ